MHSWYKVIRLTALAVLALASIGVRAAPALRAPSGAVAVGDTFSFTVYDTQIADALDTDLGMEAIDLAFDYTPGILQYVGFGSLMPDAFLTAPDLSIDADPQGSFRASWVRLADGTSPSDLFTLSFKVLAMPANEQDARLNLTQPDGGAYGLGGTFAPASAQVSVSAVPEPMGHALALLGCGILLASARRRAG